MSTTTDIPTIEEIRGRIYELKHATLHGPVPLKTTMQIVIDADFLLAEVTRLTIEQDRSEEALRLVNDEVDRLKAELAEWKASSGG